MIALLAFPEPRARSSWIHSRGNHIRRDTPRMNAIVAVLQCQGIYRICRLWAGTFAAPPIALPVAGPSRSCVRICSGVHGRPPGGPHSWSGQESGSCRHRQISNRRSSRRAYCSSFCSIAVEDPITAAELLKKFPSRRGRRAGGELVAEPSKPPRCCLNVWPFLSQSRRIIMTVLSCRCRLSDFLCGVPFLAAGDVARCVPHSLR
jgi:hypothetical protein